mgnify:CR=1 FL=1
MDFVKKEETLLIKLEGRIDSANAAEVEKELTGICAENEHEKLTIDIEKLQYISSAGLRVVLKLGKSQKNLEIINASNEVYEIFSMTGFTDIINIKKALRTISVEGCELVGKGGHGTVYRLDADTIIKVYDKTEPLGEIEREIEYARNAFVSGIPTAIAYDVVRCGESYGTVFELINSDTLANVLDSQPEKYEEYSAKYVELVHTLHTTEADTSRLSNIKDLYNMWADDMLEYLNKEEVGLIHEIINSVEERKTFVHGDIHPKNIMVQNGELLFIDMADITYGHPVFDYGGTGITHILSSENNTKKLIGVEKKVAVNLWNDLLKAEFAGKSEEEFQRISDVLIGFSWLKYAMSPAANKAMDPKFKQMLVNAAREKFLPQAKNLIGAVCF